MNCIIKKILSLHHESQHLLYMGIIIKHICSIYLSFWIDFCSCSIMVHLVTSMSFHLWLLIFPWLLRMSKWYCSPCSCKMFSDKKDSRKRWFSLQYFTKTIIDAIVTNRKSEISSLVLPTHWVEYLYLRPFKTDRG
jgi:hypothetical protein